MPRRKTNAQKLWEWCAGRKEFTAHQAARGSRVPYKTVVQYLQFWKEAGVAKEVRKAEQKGPGPKAVIWTIDAAKPRPGIWRS